MGVNLGNYYQGGVALKTSYYCYYCHQKMVQDLKDKELMRCKECNQTCKVEPSHDDELIDFQRFDDKF